MFFDVATEMLSQCFRNENHILNSTNFTAISLTFIIHQTDEGFSNRGVLFELARYFVGRRHF